MNTNIGALFSYHYASTLDLTGFIDKLPAKPRIRLRDRQEWMKAAGLVRSYGVDVLELIRDGSDFYEMAIRLTARSCLAAVKYLKERNLCRQDYTFFIVDGASESVRAGLRSVLVAP